jgi:hypothetical protein
MEGDSDRWAYLDSYVRKYCRQRIQLYEEIMTMTTDIAIIANTYQLIPGEVRLAKDYAFGEGVSRYQFIPDLDMAQAWLRMARGEGNPIDEIFLRHEVLESQLMLAPNMMQTKAHQIAQSLYPWSELLGGTNR